MAEYTCASCGGVFDNGGLKEEANKEAKDIWGVDNASQRDDFDVICDDCFQKYHPDKNPALVEKAKKELK